ncbi:MAG: diaminopimelate epimerase [bacterium]|uniref:Diaminopimelate epimerase n=1 Tax=Candidatus Infernicultor aquiphilus TaxID=1805029 RepID=A0A1J5GBJ9_9BACT|nr:diaminopimelate epimerase [bacterium]OIP66994.1 MAG: diaminopimelate epimerase [Candidatus Atribacteria bacterium CG2_30_33_13]PIU25524.1 MAG: diaminopimelate epimerase [Candidatus Atribacteria bacterium CG08_land_8_20_14_0_20_33_29]
MKINFIKMQGLGNDFILIDCLSKPLGDSSFLSCLAKRLCNRNFGIGADGLILILPSSKADLRMRIINFDGSEAEMCGNGIRCFAKYVYENKIVTKSKFTVETLAGIIIPELIIVNKKVSGIKVDMGIPKLRRREIPMIGEDSPTVIDETLKVNPEQIFKITCVSMGNPHCIIFTDDVKSIAVSEIGPQIENHSLFPQKTNVEFIQVLNRKEVNFRVWERGVGETLACGTGACASLVASILNKKTDRQTLIHLPGGDLDIHWADDGHVYMTGPAELVFRGEMEI